VAKEIRTEAVAEPSLDFAEDMLTFHFRWNVEKYRKAFLSGSEIDARGFDAYYPSSSRSVQELPVTTVLINRRIALMGVPGEPFVDFQIGDHVVFSASC
jgi:hypothetical protein